MVPCKIRHYDEYAEVIRSRNFVFLISLSKKEDMSVYEVGRSIKQEFGLLEAYDMTLEAVVTKIMWILGQTKDPARIRRMFYETVNRDILWKWSEN